MMFSHLAINNKPAIVGIIVDSDISQSVELFLCRHFTSLHRTTGFLQRVGCSAVVFRRRTEQKNRELWIWERRERVWRARDSRKREAGRETSSKKQSEELLDALPCSQCGLPRIFVLPLFWACGSAAWPPDGFAAWPHAEPAFAGMEHEVLIFLFFQYF
jgi:hypothetical protein